jgi:hypothetical protein
MSRAVLIVIFANSWGLGAAEIRSGLHDRLRPGAAAPSKAVEDTSRIPERSRYGGVWMD